MKLHIEGVVPDSLGPTLVSACAERNLEFHIQGSTQSEPLGKRVVIEGGGTMEALVAHSDELQKAYPAFCIMEVKITNE